MMDMQVVAQAVNGVHVGVNSWIHGVSTDSRTIADGSLFVALRGDRFDGHEFVRDAVDSGAAGAMVEQSMDVTVPQVVVEDTEVALGQLAADWRGRFDTPVIAVTGSNGKTTVKELIGTILGEASSTLVSSGNFNNSIGLPLSLLRFRESHRFAVVEIGMNQIGEIRNLSQIARPDIAVITNAGFAHLEHLQSVQQVAIEKGSLMSALDSDGVAVLNRDDEYFAYWKNEAAGRRVISFGLSADADVYAQFKPLQFSSVVHLETELGVIEAELKLAGAHNVINASAAVAAAIGAGAGCGEIAAGLEKMRAVCGRLQLRTHCAGGSLVDDTYNANPDSVAVALKVLGDFAGDRRLVIGDMFELGANVDEFHRDIGTQARAAGVGRLYAVGEYCRNAVREFGRGATHYENQQDLIEDLMGTLDSTTVVLVKGSHGMRMEHVANALCTGGATC
ncbi:MAG: UDP-N-acetylmuramoyl-tripeptide--D-alanyl-D-alanine ligase [Acidiferrobacterales bacterium]|nr:UDP-N-acetylmuramoyl-tripeptide--D-alanyl-D-alanine ligase [Acidiferrobacterales bacterium]